MKHNEAIAILTAVGQPHEILECEILGRRVRAFRNAPRHLRELYEEGQSEACFLVYEAERMTFSEFWLRSTALARLLREQHGVRRGDRVALSLRNYPEWMIAFAAATSIGAIAVAMNALWTADEFAHAVADCDPKVLVVDAERLQRLGDEGAAAGGAVLVVRASGPLPPWATPFPDLSDAAPGSPIRDVDLAPDDDAIMLYTSGSTGRPKGVVSTHRAVLSTLLSWELDGEASVLTGAVVPQPDGPAPVALLGIPLFHVTGLHAVFLMSFRTQRRLVSMYKWDAHKAVELIERERVTALIGPAAVTGDLVAVARDSGRDLSSLRGIGGGGAPRAPEQVRAIDAVFPNASPSTGWGMTETNALGVSIGAADYLSRPTSSGRSSAVVDLRIVDPDGRVVPLGDRGELQVRGVSMMRGYWRRPAANLEVYQDGWFRTGDVATIDADGFVYIVDRIKDLVIRGGENIGCGGVEAALLEHPDIEEASVYGVPDERLGEEVGVTLYARVPLSSEDLRSFVEARLPRHERPRYSHVVTNPLPRLASGKIAKHKVRAEALLRLGLSPTLQS